MLILIILGILLFAYAIYVKFYFKNTNKIKLITVIIVGILIFISFIFSAVKLDFDKYNNGYHKNCGGQWEFVDMEYSRSKESAIKRYVYKCDSCGYPEEFIFPHGE